MHVRAASPLALCLLASSALAQEAGYTVTVTVTVSGVHSSDGRVMATLCGEGPSPYCADHSAMTPAVAGETVLTIPDVPDGRYVLSLFHDENGDFQPQIPPEGFAFGNGASYPPTFQTASIVVDGDTEARTAMTYMMTPGAAARPAASTGAAAPDGVVKVDVRDNGLYGEFYRPQTQDRVPVIIMLGGSEGGIDTISAMSVGFAQAGFGVLALAYWNAPGLPQTLEGIPLEYFDAAVTWLQGRPGVDGDAIGVMGWSRGAEAALLAGSRNPAIKAVGAVAPSSVVWLGLDFVNVTDMEPAWTVGGAPLPYMTPDAAQYRSDGSLKPMFESALARGIPEETEIPVERINGPVLLLSGGDDAMWPSEDFAERIVARLRAAGFAHEVENLVYPDAGHMVFAGAPDGPMARNAGRPSPMMGGGAAKDEAAWEDNWPRTVAFFNAALKGRGE